MTNEKLAWRDTDSTAWLLHRTLLSAVLQRWNALGSIYLTGLQEMEGDESLETSLSEGGKNHQY
jgi:hypothetical protein